MVSLSRRLASARLNGAVVTVQKNEEPKSLEEAYQIQKEVNGILSPPSNFWKVGSTSEEAQRKLGTTQPGAARVPEQFIFKNGDKIPVFATHDLWVEGEFAISIGKNLPSREQPYSYEEVYSAINGVAPSLEFVGSRLKNGLAGSGRLSVTADGGANVALCVGQIANNWVDVNLVTQSVRLTVNGTEVASGLGSNALGDPINVAVWLANHKRVSEGLVAGEIISTGTCTGLTKVSSGDQVEAEFGPIGSISTWIVDAGSD